jgi:uncharacterized membrane protein YphA (DoxX/SURF4 family)
MSLALLLARMTLALVLLVAGTAKAGNPGRTRQTLLDFGVPRRLVPGLTWSLPLAEVGCGVALVGDRTTRWGAAGSLALFIVFLVAILWNLNRGRRPDCGCLGQLRPTPIGWGLVVRNFGLIAMAGFVLAGPGPGSDLGLVSWISAAAPVEALSLALAAAALLVAAVEGWLIGHLLTQSGRLLDRLDALERRRPAEARPVLAGPPDIEFGLPVGVEAPEFVLSNLNGVTRSLRDLRALGKPVLLCFMDPGCGPCTSLLPEVARWREAHGRTLTIVLLTRGSTEPNSPRHSADEPDLVLLQSDDRIGQAYQALATPSAVLVDLQGRIGSPVAQGAGAIRRLVERVARPTDGNRRVRPLAAAATASLLVLGTAALLGAAKPASHSTTHAFREGWVLQVESPDGWRTWWSADRAPESWSGPVQAVLDATQWRSLGAGADLGELVVSNGSLALRTRVILGRFDLRHHRMGTVRPAGAGGSWRWTIDSTGPGSVLAFNGGQFGESGPWGWLVRQGREVQAPGWGPLSMAVAISEDGDARFVSADSLATFRGGQLPQEAFQSYPALLVDDGRVPSALLRTSERVHLGHRDARLALCVLRDGRLLVALTRFDNLGRVFGGLPIGLTLGEMAAVMGAVGCRRAVSLDGGLSAQLLARPAVDEVMRWRGQRAVPLGIEVLPRP